MANVLNIEIKARCSDLERARLAILEKGAVLKGTDWQRDTYFQCKEGRLKLREGKLENALIHYSRPNQAGPKASDILLYKTADPSLKAILLKSLVVWAVVEKERQIYFAGNVKLHLDRVEGLGEFVEVEAIDDSGTLGKEKLLAQCEWWVTILGVSERDLVELSYSDLIMGR